MDRLFPEDIDWIAMRSTSSSRIKYSLSECIHRRLHYFSVEMSMKWSRRSAVCLRLRALTKRCDASEDGLSWIIWSFLATPRFTLSPLYTAHREGYISGMDSLGGSSVLLSVEPDGEGISKISGHDMNSEAMRVVVDEFQLDGRPSNICTDGEVLYHSGVVCVSLSNGRRIGWIPPPPGADKNLSGTSCVANGELYMLGCGDRKLFKTRCPALSRFERATELVGRSASAHSVEWELVADLPIKVSEVDVLTRNDGKVKFVCVGRDPSTWECCIYYAGYEGDTRFEPFERAWMCKFVPSYDELVCVAGSPETQNFPWISLVDIWSMSMVFFQTRQGDYDWDQNISADCYLAITENGLVVLSQQKTGGYELPIFGVLVSRLQPSIK
ncbi:hypothetical protein FOL46_005883 [Perkinsus olseni]|nr:hypothetical protein FOL46_005883 [Perkinsus olseni]